MKTVFVLNGPNLNLLGTREPQVYGAQTLADVQALCERACAANGFALEFRQSNHEGELVDWLHEAGQLQAKGELAGVILNAGAYTHTSVALHRRHQGHRRHADRTAHQQRARPRGVSPPLLHLASRQGRHGGLWCQWLCAGYCRFGRYGCPSLI